MGRSCRTAPACGLPLVVTDRVGAGPDLIRDGVNGHIVPADDVPALASRFVEWLGAHRPVGERVAVSQEIAQSWGYDKALAEFRKMCVQVFDGRQGRRAT